MRAHMLHTCAAPHLLTTTHTPLSYAATLPSRKLPAPCHPAASFPRFLGARGAERSNGVLHAHADAIPGGQTWTATCSLYWSRVLVPLTLLLVPLTDVLWMLWLPNWFCFHPQARPGSVTASRAETPPLGPTNACVVSCPLQGVQPEGNTEPTESDSTGSAVLVPPIEGGELPLAALAVPALGMCLAHSGWTGRNTNLQ